MPRSLCLTLALITSAGCGDPTQPRRAGDDMSGVLTRAPDAGGNRPPTARLVLAAPATMGPVRVGAMLMFDASASTDPEGRPLSFSWQIVTTGEGSLSLTTTAQGLCLTQVLQPGAGTARVVVTDPEGASSEATLLFTVERAPLPPDAGSPPPHMNRRPTARITGAPPAQLFAPTMLSLGAASSSDPDGDPLTYLWRVVDRPYGSAVPLFVMGPTLQLNPDLAGDYAVQLVVTDPGGLSDMTDAIWHLTLNGQRCVAPLPAWGFTDYQFDVPLLSSDLIRSAAQVANGQVDLRLQLCSPPFAYAAAQTIRWCFDGDSDPDTGVACGAGARGGAEHAVELTRQPDGGYTLWAGAALDACSHASFDPASNTLRVVFDAALIGSPASFDYLVLSTFSGRAGSGVDEVPQGASFLGGALSPTPSLPAFTGVSLCALRP